ncbi:PAS domain-containing protein [Rhodopseudomonas sp. HC1]|uniref:PAS domain-containing protein n=1 Tax=Rhodopseudomonas infernalis TaxID=2897386 RepID=UPI001EE7AE68|nr:PAS domain-containing protein [Rhodopseudomonas infernalis]MCG6205820.1 PAS domain-containing protein [Rhodopseudomonas infernalis]
MPSRLQPRALAKVGLDCVFAGAVVAITVAGGFGLQALLAVAPSASLFSCGVMYVAWRRGIAAAVAAIVMAILAFDYFFLPPLHSFAIRAHDVPQLVFFAAAALFVAYLCDSNRRINHARRRLELELRASHRRVAEAQRELQQTVDSIPAMLSVYRPDGIHSLVNRTWMDYTGLSLEEAARKGGTLFHPDDPERETWRQALASGRPMAAEAPIRGADGTFQWFSIRRAPLRDAGGRIQKWFSIGFNIEDRKIAEDALRDREARLAATERELRLTLDLIPTLAWRTAADGLAEYLNQRWLDYTGLSLEAARGWGWISVVHPDDRAQLHDRWQEMLASHKPGEIEARMRRLDGNYRWFLFRAEPHRGNGGEIVGWYGTNTDIEDRKRAEFELQRSRLYLAEAQKLSKTGSFAWDAAADRHQWSDETYQIAAIEPATVVTTDLLLQRIHPDDRLKMINELGRAKDGAEAWDYEIRMLMPDQSSKQLRVVAHRLHRGDEAGEIVGALMDITETRRAQEALNAARNALAHAGRIATLGEISATIAHEVNQPLAAIVANGQACLRFLDRPAPNLDDVRGAVEWIVKDGNRAAEVIRRVRGLMTKAEFERRQLGLESVVAEVVALIQNEIHSQGIVLRCDFGAAPPVMADHVQLQQVVLNLIVNAIEAMHQVVDRPRMLTISTSCDTAGRAIVAVEDSGIGVPDDPQALFDPFVSTKPNGLGMGLSICRSIIEEHGGRLWATANAGHPGATFRFTLASATELARAAE